VVTRCADGGCTVAPALGQRLGGCRVPSRPCAVFTRVVGLAFPPCCPFLLRSQVVLIAGQNFGSVELGNDIVVRYGPTGLELPAEGCSIVQPHTTIQCKTTPGAGARLKWTVLIDGLMSEAPTTAYDVPRVDRIEGPGAAHASTYGGPMSACVCYPSP
jgi:hypothetical protein